MSADKKPPDPPSYLRVEKILDGRTFVLTGPGLDKLDEGTRLTVVGKSGSLPDGTPIVLPKAQLITTLPNASYAIAQPEEVEVEEPEGFALLVSAAGRTRKVRRIPTLNVAEEDVSGNGAVGPIRVGDYVVKSSAVRYFPQILKELEKADKK